ncbi:hypothetical protein NOR51B_1061 [Luminiphilus syltensis NOR5-1B]|uniref:Uncharacterized protein n=1 Tax=Luminiphilus syltensis NOR5-1B TaxID=565045 RepID=B8KWW2_9GAMM|nr:hypothetical protein [Luminiphilus syltensis]EED35117.1 hypothetical protein NOR51B_1061 [Luminiphilus syltensis NOR5-1B]
MGIKKIVSTTSIAACFAIAASTTVAEDQLRGGMTAVQNVAGSIAGKSNYATFKWAEGRAVSSANTDAQASSNRATLKWAESNTSATDAPVASNEESADADQVRHRWGIRADADQARHRWGIRADADQARHRWGIRADADQVRHRWGIRVGQGLR